MAHEFALPLLDDAFLADDDGLLDDVLSPDFMALLDGDPAPALSGSCQLLAPGETSSARTSYTAEPSGSSSPPVVMIPTQQEQLLQQQQATSSTSSGASAAAGAACSRPGSPVSSHPSSGGGSSSTSALRHAGSAAVPVLIGQQPAAVGTTTGLLGVCPGGVATSALALAGTPADASTAAAVSSAILLLQQQHHQQQLLLRSAAVQRQQPAAKQEPQLAQPSAAEQQQEQQGQLTKQQLAALKRKAPEVDWRAISDPEERRKQRRLAKNRITAARSRERKKEQVAGLEERLAGAAAENGQLRRLLAALAAENSALREHLASLTRGAGLQPTGPGTNSSSDNNTLLLRPGAGAAVAPMLASNIHTTNSSSSPVCPEPAELNRCLANMHLVALALLLLMVLLACSAAEASRVGGGIGGWAASRRAAQVGRAAAVGTGRAVPAAGPAAAESEQQLLVSRCRLKARDSHGLAVARAAAGLQRVGLAVAAAAAA